MFFNILGAAKSWRDTECARERWRCLICGLELSKGSLGKQHLPPCASLALKSGARKGDKMIKMLKCHWCGPRPLEGGLLQSFGLGWLQNYQQEWGCRRAGIKFTKYYCQTPSPPRHLGKYNLLYLQCQQTEGNKQGFLLLYK